MKKSELKQIIRETITEFWGSGKGKNDAAEQAKKLGLVYKGYGRWADPKTNTVVAITKNGKLYKAPEENTATDVNDNQYDFVQKALAKAHISGEMASLGFDKKKNRINVEMDDDNEYYVDLKTGKVEKRFFNQF